MKTMSTSTKLGALCLTAGLALALPGCKSTDADGKPAAIVAKTYPCPSCREEVRWQYDEKGRTRGFVRAHTCSTCQREWSSEGGALACSDCGTREQHANCPLCAQHARKPAKPTAEARTYADACSACQEKVAWQHDEKGRARGFTRIHTCPSCKKDWSAVGGTSGCTICSAEEHKACPLCAKHAPPSGDEAKTYACPSCQAKVVWQYDEKGRARGFTRTHTCRL
jgi:hypothetical protein